MQPLLFDEGLYPQVAQALARLDLEANAVGDPGAPARGSDDETNIQWCQENDAVLVTNDWGRKDKTILDLLNRYRVHAIFVGDDLRSGEPHELARAVLRAEVRMDEIAAGRHMIRHRLNATGGLRKR